MKTYKYSRTDEKIYYNELENGFKICVVPNENKNSFYAVLGVKYGANDISFKLDNEIIDTNYGIAHFLEHLSFNMEDGEDPFTFFNKSGVNSNASTSFNATRYYIWGVEDFKKNLDYLLTFVLSPYFDDESVNRERGIINEEIRMYEDDANWHIDDVGRKMVFSQLPAKESIAGTYDSVSKITPNELYNCYNTFYVSNNMYLIVSGNVNYEDVMEVVNNNKLVNELKTNNHIERKKYNEKEEVAKEYQELKMNIVLPKMKYMFKIKRNKFSIKEDVLLNMYLNLLISIIFGSTSEFYEKVIGENIATGYYADWTLYDSYYLLDFVAETDKADIFKDMVDEYLENININEEDFRRIKRVWIASEIKMSDSNDMLAENIMEDFIIYNDIYPNRIDLIESMTLKELNKVIKELSLENSSFLLINPKEQ